MIMANKTYGTGEIDEKDVRIYSYILNENAKMDAMQIQLTTVSKSKPYKSRVFVEKFRSRLRTPQNPDGIIDLEIYNPHDPNNPITNQKKVYTIDALMAMSRDELVIICEPWLINPVRKSKDKLIQELMLIFQKVDENDVAVEPETEAKVEVEMESTDEVEKEVVVEHEPVVEDEPVEELEDESIEESEEIVE
jgi:hypothetical protein